MNIRKVARNAGARGERGSIPLALKEQEAGGKSTLLMMSPDRIFSQFLLTFDPLHGSTSSYVREK